MRGRAFLPAGVTLVVVAVAALAGSRISIDNDVAHLLPDTDAELVQSARALRSFLERTIIDVGAQDGSHSVELLGEVADRLVAELEASGTVLRARARLSMGDALALVDFVRARAPLYLTEHDWSEIEARVESEAVLAAVETLERRIQEPDGAVLAQQAASDPLGLANLALASLGSIAAGPPGAKLVDGRLLSADEQHLMVVIEPGFPASDLTRTARFLEGIDGIAARLAEVPAYRGVRLRQVGAHRSSKDNELQIRRDVRITSLAGMGLIALLTFLCFGRLRLVLLALTPGLVGAVVALGIFALLRERIAAPVLGFGSVLLGLTIDFAVHVLIAMKSVHGPIRIPVRALCMGALTTSLAFLLLRGSALPGIRDVGTFGSIGILAALGYSLWVLPSLQPLLGTPRPPLVDLGRLLGGAPRRTAWIVLLATPFCLLGVRRLAFDGDVKNLSSLSPAAAQDEEVIRSVWGSARMSSLMIEAPSLQAALEANDELARWLDAEERDGRLRGHASIAALLPSHATQAARAQRWSSFWTNARREQARTDLRAAAERTRFRADAFAPFLAALAETPPWIEAADLEQGPGAQLVAERVIHEGSTWRVLTPVFTDDWQQLARFHERLEAEQPGVVLANGEAMMRRIAGLVSAEMFALGWVAFGMVAAIVAVWLGDALLTLVVLLPLVLALGWTLGLLGWLGQELNLINALFVVLLFGVAIDYSIFLASAYLERRRSGRDHTAEARGSVLLCALTTCAGFGVMALAGHPVLHSIGVTAGVGIACAAVATQLFLPVLCPLLLSARPAQSRLSPEDLRGPRWHRRIAELYRYQGPFVQHYAASKARRDPLVFALPDLCAGTGRILIVGCGFGIMTARLASAHPGREIVALDPDERKLGVAQSVLGERFGVRFASADIRSWADASTCEWVSLVDVLHYWDEAAQREILRAAGTRMGPGSRLVFRDGCAGPSSGNWLVHGAEALARWTGFTRMPGKLLFHSEEKWRQLLSECGFRVESSHPELGLLSNLVLICSRHDLLQRMDP